MRSFWNREDFILRWKIYILSPRLGVRWMVITKERNVLYYKIPRFYSKTKPNKKRNTDFIKRYGTNCLPTD